MAPALLIIRPPSPSLSDHAGWAWPQNNFGFLHLQTDWWTITNGGRRSGTIEDDTNVEKIELTEEKIKA